MNSTCMIVALGPPDTLQLNEDATARIRIPSQYFAGCVFSPQSGATAEVRIESVPSPVPVAVKKALQTTTAVTSSASSAMGSPVMAMQQTRINSIFALSSCEFSHSEELDTLTSPTGMRFGPVMGQYYRGAIVGNLLLLAAFALFISLCGCMVGMACTATQDASESVLARVWRSFGLVCFPGVVVVPLCLVAQGTMMACVATLRYGDMGVGDAAIGIVGLLLCLSIWGLLLWTTTRAFDAAFVFEEDEEEAPKKASWLMSVLVPARGKWREKSTTSSYKKHFKHFFIEYRAGMQFFLCVDLGLNLCLGVLDGTRPPNQTGCNAVAFGTLVLLFAACVIAWWVRPMLEVGGQMYAMGSSALTLLCALFSTIGQFADSDDAVAAAEYMSTAVMVIGVVKTCLDILSFVPWAYRHASSTYRAWASKKRSAMAARAAMEAAELPPEVPTVVPTVDESSAAEPPSPMSVPLLSMPSLEQSTTVQEVAPPEQCGPSEEVLQRMRELDDLLGEGGEGGSGPAGAFTITSGGVDDTLALLHHGEHETTAAEEQS